ncbi:hypothetical protein PYCCODRAFT_1423464 [Trametes coccinea BRFM310]|uniref:Uncharacterized protein n=1 Tax=Trametes coccinea (strain BRFM310) TaxID=1353009 RepID=A0A1Y2IY15_TRAC3|nr:hypothetical protein PYCCODRAFT_1423464 [Trametes coccinea BRFM310]
MTVFTNSNDPRLIGDGLAHISCIVCLCKAARNGRWYIQKGWKISTEKMTSLGASAFQVTRPTLDLCNVTEPCRFHNVEGSWSYNTMFSPFQAPYYAFSQTMMAKLTLPWLDNMFFGLFGLSNHAPLMIGPQAR